MPHVILRNSVDPEEYFRRFQPWKERGDDGTVLESRAAYLRRDRQVVLVQAMSLELGPAQHFFVAVEKKQNRLTVRCHPHPTPARTEGVKAVVARIAQEVLALGGEIEKTNLAFDSE